MAYFIWKAQFMMSYKSWKLRRGLICPRQKCPHRKEVFRWWSNKHQGLQWLIIKIQMLLLLVNIKLFNPPCIINQMSWEQIIIYLIYIRSPIVILFRYCNIPESIIMVCTSKSWVTNLLINMLCSIWHIITLKRVIRLKLHQLNKHK